MNSKPRKWRSEDYKAFVRGQPCLYKNWLGRDCDGPVEAHHVRKGTDGGTALKPSDGFSVPLCNRHHQMIEGHPEWLDEDFIVFKEMVILLMAYIANRREG